MRSAVHGFIMVGIFVAAALLCLIGFQVTGAARVCVVLMGGAAYLLCMCMVQADLFRQSMAPTPSAFAEVKTLFLAVGNEVVVVDGAQSIPVGISYVPGFAQVVADILNAHYDGDPPVDFSTSASVGEEDDDADCRAMDGSMIATVPVAIATEAVDPDVARGMVDEAVIQINRGLSEWGVTLVETDAVQQPGVVFAGAVQMTFGSGGPAKRMNVQVMFVNGRPVQFTCPVEWPDGGARMTLGFTPTLFIGIRETREVVATMREIIRAVLSEAEDEFGPVTAPAAVAAIMRSGETA